MEEILNVIITHAESIFHDDVNRSVVQFCITMEIFSSHPSAALTWETP